MAKKRSEKQERMAEARRTQRRQAAKEQRKKARQKKIIRTTAIGVAAVAAVTGITVWFIKAAPLTHYIAVKETDHYSLNAAQLSFYAWQMYQQYLENAADTSQAPDTDTPFSKQNYDADTTWEEYFQEAACEYADNVLTLCEAAYAADFTPSYDVREEVEYGLSMMDVSAVPDFVTKEDMLSAMELYLLAWDYYSYMEDTLAFTEEELEVYYTEHASSMQVCSYMTFGFGYSDTEGGYLTRDDAEEYALELRRCTTAEDFEQWVVDYYVAHSSMTEEEARESVTGLYNEQATYIEGDLVGDWLFSGEAEAGDTQLIDDTDTSTLMVCLMLSAPERDTSHPISLRQVMLTSNTYGSVDAAHTQAEELLTQWEAGDQTEDSFASMADAYSEDTGASGGLYENVLIGDMTNSWKSWFSDEARQPGDVTILDNSYGAFLVYYVGKSEQTAWEQTATDALREVRYEEMYSQWETDAAIDTFSAAVGLIEAYAVS